MEYISAEEFLKQPEKVRKVFIDWWKPKIIDLYCDIDAYNTNHIDCILDEDKKMVIEIDKKYNYFIPLLTETQLRKFISDKGYKYIGINNFLELENKETWNIKVFKSMMQFEPDIEFVAESVLECYWQAAREIAKEG